MWKETRNVEREVRFMKIREGFDSINAAYTDDFFFIFFYFLASRIIIQSGKSVGFTLWSSSAIKIADQTEPSERWKNSSTDHSDDRKIRLVKLLFYRPSYDPLISRFFFFCFFFPLLFFHTRRLSNEVWLATVRENTARDSWFMRYLLVVAPSPSRFPSSSPRFCLLLVKFCFTSINHAMIIYEGRVGLAGGRFDLNMNKTIIHRNIFP